MAIITAIERLIAADTMATAGPEPLNNKIVSIQISRWTHCNSRSLRNISLNFIIILPKALIKVAPAPKLPNRKHRVSTGQRFPK